MVRITAPCERLFGYKMKGVSLSRETDAFVLSGQTPHTSSCRA